MTKLERLPTILTNNKFNERGLVETDAGFLVPAYVASQLGFNHPGKFFLNEEFYPKLRELGVLPLCPFAACSEYLDNPNLFNDEVKVKEQKEAWRKFNKLIGIVNYETLMPKAKFMISIFDGGHTVDDGVASETGFFPTKTSLPVVGIRSDIRLAENLEARINPATGYFVTHPVEGVGKGVYQIAYNVIKEIADKIREEK